MWNWFFFFFSSRRRHTRSDRDWSSDVCSSDLGAIMGRRMATSCAWSTRRKTNINGSVLLRAEINPHSKSAIPPMKALLILRKERESDSCYISPVTEKKETPQQKWAKKNRGKLAAACRRWRRRHPERQKAATYRWRRRNLAKWNAYQRHWRRRNRDRTNRLLRSKRALLGDTHNAKRRDYRRRNLSKLRSAARRYYWKNWERKRIEHHSAVAKRKGAPGQYTKQEWLQLLAAYGYRCAYC